MANRKKNRFDGFFLLFFILFFAIFSILGYSFLTRHDDAFPIRTDLYDISGYCSLSLCDCQCYPTHLMPEIVDGKICGNDCYGLLGIDGCELVDEACIIIRR